MRTRILIASVTVATLTSSTTAQQKPAPPEPLAITFFAAVRPPQVSPEGFVEQSDKVLVDSLQDLRDALDGKAFHPLKGYPGSPAIWHFVPTPDAADVVLTIAARGESADSLGSRTSMSIYRNVVLADTVPIVGVTRWVSMVLSVGTYQKEFLGGWTNQSRYSLGAWGQAAKQLALNAAGWVMLNEAKIIELQKARPGYVPPAPAPPKPVQTCAKRDGTIIPCPKD